MSETNATPRNQPVPNRAVSAAEPIDVGQAFEAFGTDIYRFTLGSVGDEDVAADLTQDVFESLAINRSQVRCSGRLKAWLLRVASNAVKQRWRRLQRSRERGVEQLPVEAPLPAPLEPRGAEPLASAGRDQGALEAEVWTALSQLSLDERLILLLIGLEGRTAPEAAQILGVSVSAARKRWQRARTRFLEIYE